MIAGVGSTYTRWVHSCLSLGSELVGTDTNGCCKTRHRLEIQSELADIIVDLRHFELTASSWGWSVRAWITEKLLIDFPLVTNFLLCISNVAGVGGNSGAAGVGRDYTWKQLRFDLFLACNKLTANSESGRTVSVSWTSLRGALRSGVACSERWGRARCCAALPYDMSRFIVLYWRCPVAYRIGKLHNGKEWKSSWSKKWWLMHSKHEWDGENCGKPTRDSKLTSSILTFDNLLTVFS